MRDLSKIQRKNLAIIGAGKVGTAIGHILQRKGVNITAVASRSNKSLRRADQFISGFKTKDAIEASRLANIILITTNDDQIESTCETLAREEAFDLEDVVFHCSGALSTEVLKSAQEKGASIGAIHPLQSFATIEGAIDQLNGSVFGITADVNAYPLACEIVETLGGTGIMVRDEDKALYHAAACVVSNYFVALVHFAQGLYRDLGVSEEIALEALLPLIKGTLSNMEAQGTVLALTGPIARGDTGPIKEHLAALKSKAAEKEKLYCELGEYATNVAFEKGTINNDKKEELHRLLQGGKVE